jgi:ADP-ribose pyrophosphatase YjhB (NUDIX family)
MGEVERLVTVVDLDGRDARGRSVSARHEAVISGGHRCVLLDDRGWSSSAPVDGRTAQEVEDTARTVVGPDGPGRGQTQKQMDAEHWAFLEGKLRNAGVNIEDGALRALPHDVEMSERLRSRLVKSPAS